ncbi:serine/threonine protein kinase [Fusarium oxysporum f. sp. lycopersici MN25]|nr:serine/threonine protein kinase [Fusarium oxysporum f. sp. lycopersici MN25]
MGSLYDDLLDDIRSQLKDGLEKKNTTEKFATRGMVKYVLSPSNLEAVYRALKAANAKMPTDTDQVNARKFAEKVKEKKLQHFLAVLIYAKCSIDAIKEFLDTLVFGNKAEFQEEDQETPNLLPASKEFLERLFSRPPDRRDFFDEQRPFCTLVLGSLDLVMIRSDDQKSLPWLEQEQIGSGAFGVVYKVTIPKGHLTTDGNFSQPTSRPMTIARKDFICVDTAEVSFKKEVRAIRDIFSGQATHDNILKSFGTIVIEGKPSTFSLLMPCADLDLQEYMKRNPEISPSDTSTRESIIRSARELAGALDFLHRKMTTSEGDPIVCYHMDLKPSNILIFHDTRRRSENSIRDMIWKLSDFGLSRVKTRTRSQADLSNLFRTRFKDQSGQASATQNFRGTDMFLPVEAELEGRTMNEKSDIWSFGCILSLLFTYMGEGYKGFGGYSESRLLCSNKNVDCFYQYNKSNIGFEINRGVVEQHEKLIKLAAEQSPSEGVAVRYMLKSLESEVLLIDQGSRCGADRIVELLQATLKKYSTVESELSITENDSMPHSLVQKAQEKVLGLFRRKSKQSLAQTNIRRWKLEVDKKLKYKDSVCSPDGIRVAYWTSKTITLFDDRSGLTNAIPYRRVDSMGSRMSSTDSERESTLTVAGQYSIADWSRSWRSVRLTNRYLIAATTDELFNCYIFDVELDRKLNMYSRVTLPHPGIHMLAVSPDRNSLACILQDKRGRPSLFTGRIAFDPASQPTPAASIYSDTTRSEHKDAGVCIADQKATLLELPPGEITCLTLETRNQGYIIIRQGSTLSVNIFIIEPLDMKEQALMQRSTNNNAERLFTDMACLQIDNQSRRSELIIASQAERLYHLRYEGFESSPTVVIHPPIQSYRILKIATVEHSRKILALGSQSGSKSLLLLNIETQSPDVRPKITKLADLGVSAGYQAKLGVSCEGNETIARIMVDMLEGRYFVFQINVSNSLGT